MAENEPLTVMTAVEDLKVGDNVDFNGDRYADEEDMGEWLDFPAVVQYVNSYEAYGAMTTAVEFDHYGLSGVVAFPYGHRVPVIQNLDKWKASK